MSEDKRSGPVFQCAWCGEQKNSSALYCKDCSPKGAKQKIFDQNMAIHKEQEAKGYVGVLRGKRFPMTMGMPNCYSQMAKE